jgi:predicted amidophosphoribosyltransferase
MIEECPICMNDYNLYTLSCNHKLCSSCLNMIANVNKLCPFCRTTINGIYKCRICFKHITHKRYNRSQCKKCVNSLIYSYYIDICAIINNI